MKGFNEFLEAMVTDETLAEKIRNAKDVDETVQIAKEAGYAVTEAEINDMLMEAVSGGVKQEVLDTTADVLDAVADALREGLDFKEALKKVGKKAVFSALGNFM